MESHRIFEDSIEQYLADLFDIRARRWPALVAQEPSYPFGQVTITEYIRRWAASAPDRPALIFRDRITTYADLDHASDRVAAHLSSVGLKVGDRVAVMMPNCPQFAVVFIGILKAGGVHVPVNPMFHCEEIKYELDDSGARFACILDDFAAEFAVAADGTAIEAVIGTSLDSWPSEDASAEHTPSDRPAIRLTDVLNDTALAVPADPNDINALAALNYTGGTTGMPKGCEHSQGDMLYTAITGGQLNNGMTPDSVALLYIPVFWIAGEDGLLLSLATGGTCVLQYRWDAKETLEAVDRHKVTVLMGTVDNFLELLDHPEVGSYDMSSLETATTMSFVTKLSVDIRRRWETESGSQAVLRESSYGMTEDHTIDTFTLGLQDDDFDLTGRQGFTGLPMPGTNIAIVDFESGNLMKNGDEGQIVVQSPSMMRGYYRRPGPTADTLKGDWLQTGDIGAFGADGCLHYLGRRKEMLKVNGMSVFPSELEFVFSRHPDIAGSGVVGIPDKSKGQVPLAFIELKAESKGRVTEEQIVQWCREHIATYKIPRVVLLDVLPKAPTGKVSKKDLEVLAEETYG